MKRVGLAVLSCLLTLVPGLAAQDTQAPHDNRVILFSAAGGVSKGSYQAGVDWTITEYLRHHRDDYALGSVSGASAGNIDALLAALSWCTAAYTLGAKPERATIAAEDSLFWNIWVTTGFTQILPTPPGDDKDPALLDRHFFRNDHFQRLLSFMTNAEGMSGGCAIPVGLSMTKQTPIEIHLSTTGQGGLPVAVQRFASIFQVATVDADGHRRLDFRLLESKPPDDTRGLGALAMMTGLADLSAEGKPNRLRNVMDFVMASSAFPGAFAPIPLQYEGAGLADGLGTKTDQFLDGGVFDNNPLALAAGLFRVYSKSNMHASELALSSPWSYRGLLGETRRKAAKQVSDAKGVSALTQMLGGAFQSASQYELQAFRRNQAELKAVADIPDPDPLQSSRMSPIYGETLSDFGAFLGRPFREYDFYAGVYDGLEFVARNFECDDTMPKDKPIRQRTENLETCTSRRHADLVHGVRAGTDSDIEVNMRGRSIISWLLADEYQEHLNDPCPAVKPGDEDPCGNDRDPIKILRVVHDGIMKNRGLSANHDCSAGEDLVTSALCQEGLLAAIKALRTLRTDANRIYATCIKNAKVIRPGQSEKEANADAERSVNWSGGCFVDNNYLSLVDHPERRVYKLITQALENVEDAEDRIVEEAKRDHVANVQEAALLAKAAFYLFRSNAAQFNDGVAHTGISWNPSSARFDWDHKKASMLGAIFPNYFEWNWDFRSDVLRMPSYTLGWRAVFQASRKFYVSVPFELGLQATPRSADGTFGMSIGTHTLKPSSAEIGLFSVGETRDRTEQSGSRFHSWDSWRLRTSFRFFAEKIQLSAWYAPWTDKQSFSFSVGFADLNGLLYWLIR